MPSDISQSEAEDVTWPGTVTRHSPFAKGQAQQDVVSDEDRVLRVQHQPSRHYQQIMSRLCFDCDSVRPGIGQ